MAAYIPETAPKYIWGTGLFGCFDDTSSCLEVVFCLYCQNGRQYNVIQTGNNDIHVGACLIPLAISVFIGSFGVTAITLMNRSDLRRRYNLQGDDCNDILTAVCCSSCATCQQYREMSLRNEWPSGTCVTVPFALAPAMSSMGGKGYQTMPQQ
jgi:Cys-rich protein (TIGR01571 family)